jgi:biopolymer transport protein ExbD
MGVLTNKRKVGKKMSLQLTSLLDMFTIILVFLMVSFQAEDKDFVLHAGLQLPQSNAQNPFKTAVNLAITSTAVIIEGKEVYKLEKGARVREADKDAGKLEAVTAAVKKAWGNKKKEEGEEDIVVIQADKSIPYRTIHMVMRSAAHSGFYRFRLAIEKE